MATSVIAAVRHRAHVKKHRPQTPSTPRRRYLSDWSRLLGRARALRLRLPNPALDHAMAEWLLNGEVLAVALAATTLD